VTLLYIVETQLISDFGSIHGVGQVLLVGKNQQHGIPKLILHSHETQMIPKANKSRTVQTAQQQAKPITAQ
jgi:hypothetical protein